MLCFEVIHTQWAADDEVFQGGVHEVAKPSAAFLRLVAGAEAAGSVRILDAGTHRPKLDRAVQSQADGEKAYTAALESGAWQEGNLAQFIAEREHQLADVVSAKVLSKSDVAEVKRLKAEIAEARATQKASL